MAKRAAGRGGAAHHWVTSSSLLFLRPAAAEGVRARQQSGGVRPTGEQAGRYAACRQVREEAGRPAGGGGGGGANSKAGER